MRPKILLVEDREDNLLSLESILEPDGYHFVKAVTEKDVLEIILTDFDVALILIDIKMRTPNGFEIKSLIYDCEKLRDIPVIFIVANNHGEDHLFKRYRSRVIDYIFRPVNAELLRTKVFVFIELYLKNKRLLIKEQELIAINRSLELQIGERITAEQRVIDLNHKLLKNIANLESTNKELDLFAFTASHDLQAPLRKVHMFSDRLIEKYGSQFDEGAMAYLSRIQYECRRMQALINDILEFSKLSMKMETMAEVDMNLLVEEVISEMEPVIREKNAVVNIHHLPVLKVNPVLMRPLFLNLVGNALKYCSRLRRPTIMISSELIVEEKLLTAETSKKYCRIFVEDNGIGFEQKYAEEIFDMFRRLHPGNQYEGTGIGLALCKKIVEKHGGYISARSRVDEGSIFIISLPYP